MQKQEYLEVSHDRDKRMSPVRFFSNLDVEAR